LTPRKEKKDAEKRENKIIFEDLSSNILSAISSPIRVNVLKLLSRISRLSFTEIMQEMELDPSNSGKFGYHLRELRRSGLITVGEDGRYFLTSLGEKIVDFLWMLEDYAREQMGEIYVRTSKVAIERFNREKIANSLIREAGAPKDLAEKIAKEAEDRLIKMKIKYLTAPLIREFVNAILLEKGLEDYRHALTRLGLPMYDVSQLIKNPPIKNANPESIIRYAGNSIFEQYTLLKILPRAIADAHRFGEIHIPNASFWALKPNEINHDLSIFIQKTERTFLHSFIKTPKTFESFLTSILRLIKLTSMNVINYQNLNYFNIFLAPYLKGLNVEAAKKFLKFFLSELNFYNMYDPHSCLCNLILEMEIPEFLENLEIFKGGKCIGILADYQDEMELLIELIADIILEDQDNYLNPKITLNMSAKLLSHNKEILRKYVESVVKCDQVTFANVNANWQMSPVIYSGSFIRLDGSWKKNDLAVNRTGNLDWVGINFPRIAAESVGDEKNLFRNLEKKLNMAYEALTIKHRYILDRLTDNMLSFISFKVNQERYYRLENTLHNISLIGINSGIKIYSGEFLWESKSSLNLLLKILEYVQNYLDGLKELANLRWGIMQNTSSAAFSRISEFNSTKFKLSLEKLEFEQQYLSNPNLPLRDRISLEEKIQPMLNGGHVFNIPVKEKTSVEEIFKLALDLAGTNIGAYSFTKTSGSGVGSKPTWRPI